MKKYEYMIIIFLICLCIIFNVVGIYYILKAIEEFQEFLFLK